MAVEILERIPSNLVAGTSSKWKFSSRDYPPSEGYGLTYVFKANAAGAGFTVTAFTSPAGDYFEAYLAPSITANKPAGVYFYEAVLTDGTDTILADSGQVKMTVPLSAQTAPYDGRSQVKQTLDAINATIKARIEGTQGPVESYTIGDRQLKFFSYEELIKLQSHYQKLYSQEIQQDRINQGGSFLRPIHVRFKG